MNSGEILGLSQIVVQEYLVILYYLCSSLMRMDLEHLVEKNVVMTAWENCLAYFGYIC